ncbi:MAG: hypothetical protein A2342_08375 [Gallionellales bacterium RIFOXYB12_FULL_54_9]|nr:MAG: hypothetical protein A2342_08375 [Gallionellales bacterium RIFOXYB12_FULL_54_9]
MKASRHLIHLTLLLACSAHAATVQFMATAMVGGSCAVVAPASIPLHAFQGISATGKLNQFVNVNCSSGTSYDLALSDNRNNVAPHSVQPVLPQGGEQNQIITVTY